MTIPMYAAGRNPAITVNPFNAPVIAPMTPPAPPVPGSMQPPAWTGMTPNSPEFAAMIANIQQRLPQQFQALLQAPWMGQQGIVGAPQSSIDASPVPKVHPAHPMRPYPVAQQAPHMGGGYGMPQFSSFMPNRTSGY